MSFEAFARVLVPVAAASMTSVELRDHAHELLTAMVEDLGALQSATEESQKSFDVRLPRAAPNNPPA